MKPSSGRQCSHAGCAEAAVELMRWHKRDKSGAVKPWAAYLCPKHLEHQIVRFDAKGVTYKRGEICVFCQAGFIQHWSHVDYGRCYRCNGTGFWAGKSIEVNKITKGLK